MVKVYAEGKCPCCGEGFVAEIILYGTAELNDGIHIVETIKDPEEFVEKLAKKIASELKGYYGDGIDAKFTSDESIKEWLHSEWFIELTPNLLRKIAVKLKEKGMIRESLPREAEHE